MLTSDEILRQIELGNIEITNIDKSAFKKPNSVTLSIGNTLYTYKDNTIVDSKDANKYIKEILEDRINSLETNILDEDGFLLQPGKVYLTKSREKIKTRGFIPVFFGRNSLSLLGISIDHNSSYKEDNYNGEVIFSIVCTKPTIIYPNIEVANLTFFPSLDIDNKEIGMISGNEIKKRIKSGDIIINPQDNIVINPNSVNLSLNKTISVYTDEVLDLKKENKTKDIEIGEDGFWLQPNEIYLGKSNEWSETNNLIPMIDGRSSTGRASLRVHCSASMGSIGYKGYWHMGMRVAQPVKVYENMKICQVYYYTPVGKITNTYNGSMQNLDKNTRGSQYYKLINNK